MPATGGKEAKKKRMESRDGLVFPTFG